MMIINGKLGAKLIPSSHGEFYYRYVYECTYAEIHT